MYRKNEIKIEFWSLSENESFARNAVAAFLVKLDPTIEELFEIKTALSEAVTNSIVHGYINTIGKVVIRALIIDDCDVRISVIDRGVGIDDIKKAREPLFTTSDRQERSGMGFTVMETFMDKVNVSSHPGKGTRVTMQKKLSTKKMSTDGREG